MTDKQVWFITGAGRGMGVDFAKAGNAVVATGRNTDAVRTAVGEAEDLLVVQLDVTSPEDAEAARRRARLTFIGPMSPVASWSSICAGVSSSK